MTTPPKTADRVKKIVADHLGVDIERVTPEANFIDDLNADSLDHIELIMALEEEFQIEIADDAAEDARTVGQAIKIVERLAGIGG